MKKNLLSLFLTGLLLTGSFLFAADIPYLTGRVTDTAEILSDTTRQSLTTLLRAHEIRSGNQIAVLTIPTIDGEPIEDYAVNVFEAWKLGQKGEDNGILVVVVPDDRRMRIEVGYGLEPIVTDAKAGKIIRHIMTPKFKNNDFDGGIADGVNALVDVLEGSELPEIADSGSTPESSNNFFSGPDLSLKERILMGAFIFGIIGLFTFIGVVTPGFGWFLYVFLIPFWATFPIAVVGSSGTFILLITYLIGFPLAKLLLKRTEWYKKAQKNLRTKGSASIGGFRVSSGRSGSSWSSGSSFSGGGGSSGGGGASGSW